MFVFTILVFIIFSFVSAQYTDRISVLKFSNRTQDFSDEQVESISERVENLLVQSGLYSVITVSERAAILKEQQFQSASGCVDQQCAVEIGRLLGASYMISGSLLQLDNLFVLSARLFTVETGEIEKVAEYSNTGELSDLYFTGSSELLEQLTGLFAVAYGVKNLIPLADSSKVGFINLDSDPQGMTIYLDSLLTEYETPIFGYAVIQGDHRVRLESENHYPKEAGFSLTEGDSLELGILQMQPKTCIMDLSTSEAGAEVRLNGNLIGITPLQESVNFGEYDLQVTLDGYESFQDSLSLKVGYFNRTIDLLRKSVEVKFSTIPGDAGATLYLNGDIAGYIPVEGKTISVFPGEYKLTLKADGYRRITDRIQIAENNTPGTPSSVNMYSYTLKKDEITNLQHEDFSPDLSIGAGLSMGYPGLVNYEVHTRYSFFVAEYSGGLLKNRDLRIIDKILDHSDRGISGHQFSIGLGTGHASLQYVLGKTNAFSRNPDSSSTLQKWAYHGLSLRKKKDSAYWEIGWVWGDHEVFKSEAFYFKIGFGFSVRF